MRDSIDLSLPLGGAALRPEKLWFAAVVDYKRFASFRNRIGYTNANGLLHRLAKPLMSLPEVSLGRFGRTNVEIVFSAKSKQQAEDLVGNLLPKLQERVSFKGIEYEPQPVFGICEVHDTALTDYHFDRANAAISIALRSNQHIRFACEDIVLKDRKDELELLHDLQQAIEHEELTLAYMPKLGLRTGRIEAVECLCRWDHPLRGPISPEEFIAMADESGMMEQLTLWIAKMMIADQRTLAAHGIKIQFDLNLSASLVSNIECCNRLIELISGAEGRIGVEITETAVIEHPEIALENLNRLVKAGAWLAIDDYGSGLSSLSYLRQIPAHELKIDRSFVTGITKSNRDPLLVRSSIELAHSLEMLITAEGVEDDVTLSLLQVMGCDFIQGYWLSRALPLNKLTIFLEDFDKSDRVSSLTTGSLIKLKKTG